MEKMETSTVGRPAAQGIPHLPVPPPGTLIFKSQHPDRPPAPFGSLHRAPGLPSFADDPSGPRAASLALLSFELAVSVPGSLSQASFSPHATEGSKTADITAASLALPLDGLPVRSMSASIFYDS